MINYKQTCRHLKNIFKINKYEYITYNKARQLTGVVYSQEYVYSLPIKHRTTH